MGGPDSGVVNLELPQGDLEALGAVSSGLHQVIDRAEQTHLYQHGPQGEVTEDWEGVASMARAQEAGAVRTQLMRTNAAVGAIATAVQTYTVALEEAISTAEGLQVRWDEAQETYLDRMRQINDPSVPWPDEDRRAMADRAADVRDEEHDRLRVRRTEAIEELKGAGTAAASTIGGACEELVPADIAGREPLVAGHLFGGLAIAGADLPASGEIDDLYGYFRDQIDAGEMTDFADMSESERLEFLEENPGLLEHLMAIGHLTQQIREDVLALALPRLDATDADADIETILAGIADEQVTLVDGEPIAAGGGGRPASGDVVAAFSRSGQIVQALELLGPWMQQHGVDASGHPNAQDAIGYLTAFGQRTWEHRGAIEAYLNEGFTRTTTHVNTELDSDWKQDERLDVLTAAQKDAIRANWANVYLAASQEEIGGGWESLPPPMRAYIPHVDVDLAEDQDTVTAILDRNFEDVARFLLRADTDLPPGDRLAVELANHANHQLTNTLATSTSPYGPVPQGSTGAADEEFAGAIFEMAARNRSAITALLTGQTQGITGFNADALPGSHDPAGCVERLFSYRWEDGGAAATVLTDWIPQAMVEGDPNARAAWHGYMEAITDTGQGTFRNLMGTVNEGPMLERNPALATSAAIQAHQQQIADDYIAELNEFYSHEENSLRSPSTSRPAGGSFALVQSKLDAGIYNAAVHEGLSSYEAEQQRVATLTTAADLLAAVIPHPGADVANAVFQGSANSPPPDPSIVGLPSGWRNPTTDATETTATSFHVARIENMLLRALGGDVGNVGVEPTAIDADTGVLETALTDQVNDLGLNSDARAEYREALKSMTERAEARYGETYYAWTGSGRVRSFLDGAPIPPGEISDGDK